MCEGSILPILAKAYYLSSFIITFLVDTKCYLIVVSICIFLMTNYAEHLFMY